MSNSKLTEHGSSVAEDDVIRNLPRCPACGESFSYRYQLHWHFQLKHRHQQVTLFVCDECNETFTEESSYDDHCIEEHGGSVSCTCEKCAEKFITDLELRRHHLTHKKTRTSPNKKTFAVKENSQKVQNAKFFIGQKIPDVGSCRGCFSKKDFHLKHPKNHISEANYIKSMKKILTESSEVPISDSRCL